MSIKLVLEICHPFHLSGQCSARSMTTRWRDFSNRRNARTASTSTDTVAGTRRSDPRWPTQPVIMRSIWLKTLLQHGSRGPPAFLTELLPGVSELGILLLFFLPGGRSEQVLLVVLVVRRSWSERLRYDSWAICQRCRRSLLLLSPCLHCSLRFTVNCHCPVVIFFRSYSISFT